MKKLLLFILLSLTATARKLPYPIIFVHGLNSSDKTWYKTMQEFEKAGFALSIDHANQRAANGSQINFNLNADGNRTTSLLAQDVKDLNSYINPDNDVFFINFDNGLLSNQSAIKKQGYALSLAIKRVLFATSKTKVVLFGHSMGGLAVRSYLQQFAEAGKHNVYQVITTGTPHGGSNIGIKNILSGFLGYIGVVDENSEAVRDLRTTFGSGTKGTFLFGGKETDATHEIGKNFYNQDTDCNGILNTVEGLNSPSMIAKLPLDIIYTCIINEYNKTLNVGDVMVTTFSQNLNNFAKKPDGFGIAGEFEQANMHHWQETENYYLNIDALRFDNILLNTNQTTYGFFGSYNFQHTAKQASYIMFVPEKGTIKFLFNVGGGPSKYMKANINNQQYATDQEGLTIKITEPTTIKIQVSAEVSTVRYRTFALSNVFVPEPIVQVPIITATENLESEPISIFPNPTTEKIQINGHDKPFYVYTQSGQVIVKGNTPQEVSFEKSGMYFVKIENQTFKIFVEK